MVPKSDCMPLQITRRKEYVLTALETTPESYRWYWWTPSVRPAESAKPGACLVNSCCGSVLAHTTLKTRGGLASGCSSHLHVCKSEAKPSLDPDFIGRPPVRHRQWYLEGSDTPLVELLVS